MNDCYYCNGNRCDNCGSDQVTLHTRAHLANIAKSFPHVRPLLEDMIREEIGYCIYCHDCTVTYAIKHCRHKTGAV